MNELEQLLAKIDEIEDSRLYVQLVSLRKSMPRWSVQVRAENATWSCCVLGPVVGDKICDVVNELSGAVDRTRFTLLSPDAITQRLESYAHAPLSHAC